MRKLINEPRDFVKELVEGILLAHGDQLQTVAGGQGLAARHDPGSPKVAITTGGGSGHLPLFLGYVGAGMLDGAAIGGVFNSPSAETMVEVTRTVSRGQGVLYLYGNYGGDVMNFDLAAELAGMEGIDVRTVLGADDVASAPKGEEDRRRGIAGIVLLYKIAGAAAARGDDLNAVEAVTLRAASTLRSMGVALSACTLPEVGKPTFAIAEDQMEIGMGIHGEPGVRVGPLEPADHVVEELLATILADLDGADLSRVALMVNGLGATPREELYILYRRAHTILAERGSTVVKSYVGEYATSLEMAGASISILAVDDELLELLNAPARTPFFAEVGAR
jgi:dihydroxyacetone kinase